MRCGMLWGAFMTKNSRKPSLRLDSERAEKTTCSPHEKTAPLRTATVSEDLPRSGLVQQHASRGSGQSAHHAARLYPPILCMRWLFGSAPCDGRFLLADRLAISFPQQLVRSLS